MHIEEFQHLVEHLTVLSRDNDQRLEILRFFHCFHERRHLNGFGTGPEYKHDLFHSYTSFFYQGYFNHHLSIIMCLSSL